MIFRNSKLLLILLSLTSFVLSAALISGVYSIRAKNRKTSELLNTADRIAEAGILAQSVRIARNDAQEELAAFESMVLSGDKLVPLIEDIEEAGRTLGLNLNIISVGEAEAGMVAGSKMIRIVMETQGSWGSTFSFLRAIESLPHRVMIEESGLTRSDTGWRSRLVLGLYSFD